MRVFLSALEGESSKDALNECIKKNIKVPFGLVSFYYIYKNKNGIENFKRVLSICDYVLVDSGAHTFQLGTTVDWEEYTKEYAQFIKKYDCPKILGYFEMDVDIQIGYDRVLALRKVLNRVSDKIIPVWHKSRGISEFKRMCCTTKGDIAAITGFKNEDIKDKQYPAFVKYAWKCGKKIHCLGMTRKKVLDKIPFDYADSSTWIQGPNFGELESWNNRKKSVVRIKSTKGKYKTQQLRFKSLLANLQMVRYYNIKWQKINQDLYF